ncbi:hypothetical protein EVAR_32872_1 [Eumeta japonica]|uniref:Uncharacterized protein n=1 Tax=Eumeta variegata TaxID=151549 RepID=A0A4C1VQW4_EUMVA|nr:hypothetical protein EVAR_32872_1 [Eumeta japonica]
MIPAVRALKGAQRSRYKRGRGKFAEAATTEFTSSEHPPRSFTGGRRTLAHINPFLSSIPLTHPVLPVD